MKLTYHWEGNYLIPDLLPPESPPIGTRFGLLVFYELCGSVATCRIMSVSSSTDSLQPLTSHA